VGRKKRKKRSPLRGMMHRRAVEASQQARRRFVGFQQTSVLRVSNLNPTESDFFHWHNDQGLPLPHRGGWPDFLCRLPTGKIYAVETKTPGDSLHAHQIRCAELLEQAGIPVYIWRPDHRRLRHWRRYLGGLRPGRETRSPSAEYEGLLEGAEMNPGPAAEREQPKNRQDGEAGGLELCQPTGSPYGSPPHSIPS